MFSLLKKYELRGAKRRVSIFNRFRIESVLKIAPYHTLKFGGIGKMPYLCIVIQERAFNITGDQRWNRWGRGRKGAKAFFYLFTFLPLKAPFYL